MYDMNANSISTVAPSRWLTIQEAIDLSEQLSGQRRNEKYFMGRLAHYGDRSRLEWWAEQGLAEKANSGRGPWLIHPLVLG